MSGPVRRPGEDIADYVARLKAARAAHDADSHAGPSTTPSAPRRAVVDPPPSNRRNWDPDLVPEVPVSEAAQEQLEISEVLGRIDIAQAYERWCGKSQFTYPLKEDGNLVSCPNPLHPDKNPSYSVNTKDNVGKCFGCDMGFDMYDIAAWHFGFDVPGYKSKENFPELRRRMAEDLGYRVIQRGKEEWLVKAPTLQPVDVTGGVPIREEGTTGTESKQPVVDSAPPVISSPPPNLNQVLQMAANDYEDGAEPIIGFDWRELGIPTDTFLYKWLEATSVAHQPEEFYFWLGLEAIGAACGNQVVLWDEPAVRANLMLCLVGPSGVGKSTAVGRMHKLIDMALPWDDDTGGGVFRISQPGSGEALIDQFVHIVDDGSGVKKPVPVNGLYIAEEFMTVASLMGRAGSIMKPTFMDLYDRTLPVSTRSRTSGLVTAHNHYMQVASTIQTKRIRGLLSRDDASAGFVNRWIFAMGTPKRRPAWGAAQVDLDPCIQPLQSIRGWASPGKQIEFRPGAAADEWTEFFHKRVEPLGLDDQDMTSRLDLIAKKILLLLAANDRATTVMEHHVAILQKLWPYMIRCCESIGMNIGMTELEECTGVIIKYFSEHPGTEITVRILQKQSSAKRFPQEVILKALQHLEGHYIERIRSARATKWIWLDDDAAVSPLATVTQLKTGAP